jgi:queuine tRNA-ribosyltransferase
MYPDLRRQALEELAAMYFEGYALGGLSVGEPKDMMEEIVGGTAPLLPRDKPRYLMGVGTPEDIVKSVSACIDLFDCVLPTRCARNGLLFTNTQKVVISTPAAGDELPSMKPATATPAGTIRVIPPHLFMAREILAMVLNTIHNVRFYLRLMERIREEIRGGFIRSGNGSFWTGGKTNRGECRRKIGDSRINQGGYFRDRNRICHGIPEAGAQEGTGASSS